MDKNDYDVSNGPIIVLFLPNSVYALVCYPDYLVSEILKFLYTFSSSDIPRRLLCSCEVTVYLFVVL